MVSLRNLVSFKILFFSNILSEIYSGSRTL